MVASRGNNSNPARIPALGLRTLVLIFISMGFMYLDNRDNHLDRVRDAIGVAVYPLRVVVDAPARLWVWMDESSVSRNELQLENSRLKAEQLHTRAKLLRLSALEAENARLRTMLLASQAAEVDVRVAEILAVDPNQFRHSLILDVGSRDGAYDGQAIVDADGVIGQIMYAGPMTSQALLISDPGHALPVEVNRNGLRTIAYGTGEYVRLDLPGLANSADIQPGDLLVTSGLGGAFPAGYPVAVVETVNLLPQRPFADVSARPIAALDQVREVMLVESTLQEAPAPEAASEDDDG